MRYELRDINCTLFATSQTPFIYNTCTDCVKLYISDQQAKAAWRAPRKLNNTQLPPGSLFYSLWLLSHGSRLATDWHSKVGGKKEAVTSCCEVDPAAPSWTPILERTQSLMGGSSSSAEAKHTGERLCVFARCWVRVEVEALESKSVCVMYGKGTNECGFT